MANWCYNRVEFTGSKFTLKKTKSLFDGLQAKGNGEQNGQLPPFITVDEGYFFDIQCDDCVITYETRWAPNTDILQEIADEYGVGFIHHYEESGNCIYGEAVYKDGILTDVSLDFEDFHAYEVDEEADRYLFEGDSYECSDEILEILLDRKKAIQ